MDIASIIGIIASFGFVLYGYAMEGGNVAGLMMLSAMVITCGGTLGAVMLSFGFENLKNFPKLVFEAFRRPKSRINQTIDFLISLSRTAKQNGLLSLEKSIIDAEGQKGGVDPYVKKGILLAVDGTDPEKIEEILSNDIYIYEQRRLSDIAMFEVAAQYAPAFGMIGTIVGLIQMLSMGMDDPNTLTKAIGVAFITTLYGSLLANGFFSPIAQKLKNRLATYRLEKEIIISAVCAIRNGINPKMLHEQLEAYATGTKRRRAEVLRMVGADRNTAGTTRSGSGTGSTTLGS